MKFVKRVFERIDCFDMEDAFLTTLSMENHCNPSTLLSIDSSGLSSHDELEHRRAVLTRPPDINLPSWNPEHCGILNVGIAPHLYESENFVTVPKVGRKCGKRVDSIWGAWLFFTCYLKPVLKDRSKKIIRDGNGISGFDKSDLKLDVFMVQHDMENMYMWVFKERPENALGKMQLRSYMNGHSREGVRPFPFSVDKGFVRSHRMQRKHYRGLSNPQCVHGVEVVPSPNFAGLDEDDRRRWMELTGREPDFIIPPEASDYGSWRNMGNAEFELEKPIPPMKGNLKQLVNGSVLNLSTHLGNYTNGEMIDLSPVCNKRKKDFDENCDLAGNQIRDLAGSPNGTPQWLNGFSGVLRNVYGPVTAAKTMYEDEQGYLIVVSLPFVDLQRVKVSWRNTVSHGIIKVCCTSVSRMPFIKRNNRTFKLTDPNSEHCPPGEFVREIPLSTRIPEDANIEAYYDEPGTVLEIVVPKLHQGLEEHEVRVQVRSHRDEVNDLMFT